MKALKYFILETHHDTGTELIKTVAKDAKTAINNFCSAYLAPPRAVKKIYEFNKIWFGYNSNWIIQRKLAKEVTP